ncbi:hypothetical protein HBO34_15940 [Pseudomonas veronii]|uniref:hypothetical protein n=1 Tax=Pseudomonas veronii TaxID=76761 RepID=UPI001473A8B0|nr:hypothetical protein [Pseudomonas veronii]NMX39366.1 hypothetical protein [Pseudomonas veronii]
MQEFPRWVYHRSESARVVETADEQKALGKEWAVIPFPKDPEPAEKPLEDLQAQATKLGIEFDGRWGAKRLQNTIDAFIEDHPDAAE